MNIFKIALRYFKGLSFRKKLLAGFLFVISFSGVNLLISITSLNEFWGYAERVSEINNIRNNIDEVKNLTKSFHHTNDQYLIRQIEYQTHESILTLNAESNHMLYGFRDQINIVQRNLREFLDSFNEMVLVESRGAALYSNLDYKLQQLLALTEELVRLSANKKPLFEIIRSLFILQTVEKEYFDSASKTKRDQAFTIIANLKKYASELNQKESSLPLRLISFQIFSITNSYKDTFEKFSTNRQVEEAAYLELQKKLEHSRSICESIYLELISKMEKNHTREIIFAGLFFLFSFLFSIFFSFFISKIITAPITQLVTLTKQISKRGDYSQKISIETDDEIGILGESFNKMLEALEENHQALESRITQKTAEYLAAKEQAEESSRMKSNFFAMMNHELRSPLNTIVGFSEVLSCDERLHPDQKKQIEILNRSSNHLLTIVNNILDISKIESGKVELHLSTFSLDKAINEVIEMMSIKAKQKGLHLTVARTVSPNLLVTLDLTKFNQILVNLISNAIKYTKEGGVTLSAFEFLKGAKKERFIILEIEDTGPGISLEDQETLFTPFVRVGNTSTQTGTGLGLSIAKQFAKMLGGDIRLISEKGQGTKFIVELPIVPNLL